MIPVAGASLIAQVYPVAMLLLLLETGRSFRDLSSLGRFGRALAITSIVVTFLAVTTALGSVAVCLQAAVNDQPIDLAAGIYVVVAGWALFVATACLIAYSGVTYFYEWLESADASKRAEVGKATGAPTI